MGSCSPRSILPYLLISIIVFLAFSPCLHADFLNFDDPQHFLQNQAVIGLSSDSVKAIFIQTVNNVYIPLTTLSFAIEHHFFGFNEFVFHLDNLLLHVVNVSLVLLLALRFGFPSKTAFLAALIFGIHPTKVESVAWVTERKDALYALFYLLAMHQYWSFLKHKTIGAYMGTLLYGFVSMLAKPMALSLPLILLLLDWFHGRRWDKNVFIEKIPFFLYTAQIGSLSYLFNMRNPISDIAQAVLVWTWSFNFYICKFLWPYHVSFIYSLPHPINWANGSYIASVGMFIVIMGMLIRWRNNRLLIFAFGYYFLSIFFLLRFDDKVDFTVVSDRFMYLPSLGFCLGLGVVFEQWVRPKKIFIALVLIFIVFLGGITFKQCRIWQNSLSFWDEIVRQYPRTSSAYYSRGATYSALGAHKLALADFSKAIDLSPLRDDAYFDRASLLASLEKYQEALGDINRAIQLNPSNLKAYVLRAAIEEKIKNFPQAIKDLTYVQQLTGISFTDSLKRLQGENK
jgi:protein O-mannosyl-transferase